MAKKVKSQKSKETSKYVTKRRMARWQREKRKQRITFSIGLLVVLIVAGVIAGGAIATISSDWLSRVHADSGTVTIKKADYAEALNLIRHGLYQSTGNTKSDPLNALETTLLIKDGAAAAGISVTDSEITAAIRPIFETGNESLTDGEFEEAYEQMLEAIGISDKDFRDIIANQLLSEKLLQSYIDRIPETGEQAAVETIVVYNGSTANAVTQAWREGEDFETLAQLYGDMSDSGWLIKGTMEEVFDDVAFSIEIGSVSDPIASEEEEAVYYIIKVLARQDGPIDETLRRQSGLAEYEKWYYRAYDDKVERNPKLDLNEVYQWALKQIS